MDDNITIHFIGISEFYYSAIPAVLGVGAFIWLMFGEELRSFIRSISYDKRLAAIVGGVPKKPLEIIINNDNDKILIDRAEINGEKLLVYYRNISSKKVKDVTIQWKMIALNGTIIKGDDYMTGTWSKNDAPGNLEAGEKGEAQFIIDRDNRAVRLSLRGTTQMEAIFG